MLLVVQKIIKSGTCGLAMSGELIIKCRFLFLVQMNVRPFTSVCWNRLFLQSPAIYVYLVHFMLLNLIFVTISWVTVIGIYLFYS